MPGEDGKKLPQRYDIWSVAQQDQAGQKAPVSPENKPQNTSTASSHISKLDDLQTSMLLYGYGLPMKAAVSGISKLANGQTAHCTTKKISSESVDLIFKSPTPEASKLASDKSQVGSAISLDLEEIGAFNGIISSQSKDGFQVAVDSIYKAKLSSKLTDMASKRGIKHDVSIATGPGITRIELKDKKCSYKDGAGVLRKGRIVNLSQVDALIGAQVIPTIPAIIIFEGARRYAAEVTSTVAIGFMVKFSIPIPATEFSEDLKFY